MRSEASRARPPSSPGPVMRSRRRRARSRRVPRPDSESRSAGGRSRSARRRSSLRGAFRCSDGAARGSGSSVCGLPARLVCGTVTALCKGRSRPREARRGRFSGAQCTGADTAIRADRSAGRLADRRADRPTPAASEKPAVERWRVLRWLRAGRGRRPAPDGVPRNRQLSRLGVASYHRIAVTMPTGSRAGRRHGPFRPAATGRV